MAEKAVARIRVTVMLGNSLTDRDTLAVLELLQPESPAEVLGLYIEDSELLSLADIPVVREYCLLTQVERRLQAAELERQFRAQARIAEQARPKLLVLYHLLFFNCGEKQLLREVRREYQGQVVLGQDLGVY